jgi:glycosyltransferase involved in cell wall biosynthesis
MIDDRIKILHLITNFSLGGAQDYLYNVVQGLDRNIFDIYIAGRFEGEWIERFQGINGAKVLNIKTLNRDISIFKDIKAIFEIYHLIKKYKIQIIHTHSSKAGIIGRTSAFLAKARLIIHTVHGYPFHDFMPLWQKYSFIFIEKIVSKFTDGLIFVSEKDKRTGYQFGITAKRFNETIYNPIDYSPFINTTNRDETRKYFGFEDTNYVIGFTGRFSEQKAVDNLVDAFAEVNKLEPQTRLLLVGDGSLKEKITKQIQQLGLTKLVNITGFRNDVPTLLKAMDIFVMTSLWEGLSRSLIEAMYAKLPIVATDVGGTSDAVQHQITGLLVKPKNIEEIKRAIIEFIDNPEKANLLSQEGHKWSISNFEITRMQNKINNLYIKLYNRT